MKNYLFKEKNIPVPLQAIYIQNVEKKNDFEIVRLNSSMENESTIVHLIVKPTETVTLDFEFPFSFLLYVCYGLSSLIFFFFFFFNFLWLRKYENEFESKME